MLKRITAACWGYQGIAPSYLNELKATVTGANTVQVATGGAMVDGKCYNNSAAVNVNIPSASGGGNTRIDRIVVRCSWAGTDTAITRIAGTDAASPTAPAITQTSGTTYDIQICQVLVTTGGTCTVTDERDFAEPPELAIAVLGNSANTAIATWGAIAAASDHTVLQRHGTSAGFAAIQAGMFAADSITAADIGTMVPVFLGRQGGSATDWDAQGTTNYSSGVNPRFQCGVKQTDASSDATVTFPVPFTNNPLPMVCVLGVVHTVTVTATSPTAMTARVYKYDGSTAGSGYFVAWYAVGSE